jgi:hypothetical protein
MMLRVLGPPELEQIAKLTVFLGKLGMLDITVEVHDEDGVKLGEVRRHEDWGYVFLAEKGGEVGG